MLHTPSIQYLLRAMNTGQRVVDSAFNGAGLHVLSGSGISTSAVAAGVLTIASLTNVYFIRPAYLGNATLEPGSYSVTFAIGTYLTGSIAPIAASDIAFANNLVSGTSRSANGTYTETITLAQPGYIGLGGKGAAIVNSMTIDNLTITRVS